MQAGLIPGGLRARPVPAGLTGYGQASGNALSEVTSAGRLPRPCAGAGVDKRAKRRGAQTHQRLLASASEQIFQQEAHRSLAV